jgi:acetyl esterase/lipase
MQSLFILIIPFLAIDTAFSAEKTKRTPSPEFPSDVRVERAISFLSADRNEKGDLYFPTNVPGTARWPAVIVIHGGGFVGGRRDASRELNICSTLARNGYVAMSIDYLLSSNKHAVWPTNLWDCKTAVRWLRHNADKLHVNPNRVGVLGGSAGGHLAAMVALTTASDRLDPPAPLGDVPCGVNCCIDLYGIADLTEYHDVPMLGKTLAEAPALYREASPITYVRSTSPPFLILHGSADTTVNPSQSKALAHALETNGVPHRFVLIEGAPHSFHLQPAQRDLRPIVLDFLGRHLMPSSFPTGN